MTTELLSNVQVKELSSGAPILDIDSKDSLGKTFLIMAKNNILCAPVRDFATKEYVGLIDVIDIACYMVDHLKKTEIGKLSSNYVDFLQKEDLFTGRLATAVVDLAKRNQLHPVSEEATLLDVVQKMVDNHVQRVPVVDRNGNIKDLITQSAVMTHIAKHVEFLSPFLQKTLKDLNLAAKDVISVDARKPAIEAFKLMVEKRISGLAVVDNSGKLMANVSAYDLRSLQQDSRLFEKLLLPVSEFVTHVRQANFRAIHPGISCTTDETLQKLIMRMSAAHIHRMFVVDGRHYPVSVVSLPDIFEKLLQIGAPLPAGSGVQ